MNRVKSIGKLLVLVMIIILAGAGGSVVYGADSDFEYYESYDGTSVIIYGYYGKEENLVIPEEIDGYRVASVYLDTFEDGEVFNTVTHTITLPSGIANFRLIGLGELTDIYVDEKNENFKSIDGMVYSKDGSSLVSVPVGRTGTLKILEGTKSAKIDAFSDCKRITGLEIPESLTEIEMPMALTFIEKLEQVIVSEENEVYSSTDGIIYDKKKETLLFCPPGKAGEVTLPDTVKTIGKYAFENCINLEKVVLPEGIEKIEYAAFSRCEKISEMSLPSTLKEIQGYAFEGCSAMKSIQIPAGVEVIGKGVVMDSGVTDVVIDEKNEFFSFQDGALYNKEGTVILQCMYATTGELKIKEGVKEISSDAFSFSGFFTSVTIPESVTKIGDNAFYYCNSLRSVTIPGSVTEIGENVFCSCEELQSVQISEGVTTIAPNMFQECYALRNVTLPSTLTRIESEAFAYTRIETIEFPESLTYIGESAFSSTNFSEVHIPKNVTEIGGYAFFTDVLQKVYIDSEKIVNMGMRAFGSWENQVEIYVLNQEVSHLVKTNCIAVNVILVKPAEPLEISKSRVTLYTGSVKHFATVTVKAAYPEITGEIPETVRWTTSNSSVAVVKNGKITAVKKGKAVITATVGKYKKTVSVTVKNPVITVVDGSEKVNTIKVKKGKTVYYRITTDPSKSKVKLIADKNSKKFAKITLKNNTISVKGIRKGNVSFKLQSGGGTKKVTLKVR